MVFAVSSAEVDITPASGENPYLAGYASQVTPRAVTTDTPRSALKARCVIFWSESRPFALVSVDVLAIPRAMSQRLRPRFRELAEWSDADVVVHCSHTHNGPVLVDHLHPFASYGMSEQTRVRRYTERLETVLVDLVRTALAAEQVSVTLDYRVASETFARNRRGFSHNETAVPVLVARTADGQPRIVLFGYGAHATSGGIDSRWDGDYPSSACAAVERAHPGATVMFFQGPAGDQGPTGVSGMQLSDTLGAQLGATVVRSVQQPGRLLDGPLSSRITEFPLPLAIATDQQTLASFRAAYVERIRNDLGYPAYYVRHAEVMISRIDTGNIATSVPFVAHAWTFAGERPLRVVLTSGELTSGYAVDFRSRHGGPEQLWIGGYANEVTCYIPTDQFFPPTMTGGSYEGGWSSDFPAVASSSMAAYGWEGRFQYGPGGVQTTVTSGLTALLA